MNIQHHEDPWRKMLRPSQLSVSLTIGLALIMALLTLYYLFVYDSSISELLKVGLSSESTSRANDFQAIRTAVEDSGIAAFVSSFALWFLVGSVGYLAATTLWHTLTAARADLESVVTQNYSGKLKSVVEIIARLVLRTIGLLLLYLAYKSATYFVSWFLLWLYQMSSTELLVTDLAVAALSIAWVAATMYAATVGLRLLLLRVRVFS